MAVILQIETSGPFCSVCLADNAKIISEKTIEEPNRHASMLTVLIDQCVKEAGLRFQDIHAIAICDGPGSYTGLRIGAATAKGLCYTLNIPLIAINALEIMTHNFSSNNSQKNIMPIIQARKDAFYFAVFNSRKELINDYKSITLSDIDPGLIKMSENTYVIFSILNENISQRLNTFTSLTQINSITAAQMTILSQKYFENGCFKEIISYEPNYLSGFGKLF